MNVKKNLTSVVLGLLVVCFLFYFEILIVPCIFCFVFFCFVSCLCLFPSPVLTIWLHKVTDYLPSPTMAAEKWKGPL